MKNQEINHEKVMNALFELLDYSWEAEQKHWEETTGKTYPDDKPDPQDQHIFRSMVLLNDYMQEVDGNSKLAMTSRMILAAGGSILTAPAPAFDIEDYRGMPNTGGN